MDIYKISIALAMSSNHSAVLGALSSQLLGVHARVNQLTGGFNRLKLAIGGALAATAGVALLDTMGKIVEKTKDYSDELAKLRTLGGGIANAAASGALSRRAFDIAQRVPMTVTDLAKIPGSAYSILGYEDADKMWEPLARFQWSLQNQSGFKGDAGEEMGKFLRSGELSGRLTDPTTHKAAIEELQRFLDLSTRVMAATHGMVTPSTMLGMAQQAGFSMRGMTDEGFMNMAIMAQAMGGPRAGTAMLSLYNQLATGKMTKPAALGLQSLGLLGENDWHSDHGHVVVNPEAARRLGALLGKNPMDFVAGLYDALEKQGVTDPEEQKRRVAEALSRQTSQRFTTEMMMNREQMAAERERMAQGLGSDASFGIFNNQSVTANLEALQNAWTNLLTAVAGPNSQNVISLLQSLTGWINYATKSVNEMNPETLSNAGRGLAALGAVFTGAGAAAMLAAIGPAGWLIGGLAGLAVVLANPDLKNALLSYPEQWLKPVKDFFLNMQNTILSGINAMSDAVFNALKSMWDKIVGYISGFGGGKGGDFKKDLDDANKLYVPNRFVPGERAPRAQPIALSLNVDGRTLAQAISDQLESLYNFSTGAPSADGVGRFGGADGNKWDI